LQRAVEVQPCFNRDVLRDLSDRATTSRLDLEAWAEGENIQYDTTRPTDKVIGQRVGTDESDIDLQILQAVATGNLVSLREWIVRLQGSPNASDRFTRIFLASINDSSDEALGLLLETNLVDLHAEDDINERNCLHEAAIYGRELVLHHGLAKKVDPSRADVYGRIPLHYACLKGRMNMVKTLLEAGKDNVDFKDHDGFTPLIHSIIRHQLSCVQQLLQYNANIDPITEADQIPLNLACQHGSMETAALLLKQGARLLPDAEGLYPQHLVARSSRSPDLLLLLKTHGADLNQRDKLYQWTPLFHAASEGRIECLRMLLQIGVDVDTLDEKGLSAMYYATWEGHLECMEQLWQQSSRSKPMRDGVKSAQATTMPVPVDTSSSHKPQEVDGIPDLALPPPIIPLRRYGHNFLDTKTLVSISFPPGPEAITFFNEGRYPAARITISSKLSDLIPRNIMLPIQEESRNVSFQIDSLNTFAVDFEVFPTFGSKVIAKSVALPDVFRATESSSGSCCLPLFDPRLRAVGQIKFDFQVIKPYHGDPLDITHFATYWKATGALDDQSGLVTGSSLSGDYLRLYVQLTRDAVPVVYPAFRLDYQGLQIPIGQLTCDELSRAMVQNRPSVRNLIAGVNSRGYVSSTQELQTLTRSTMPLQDILADLRTDLHLNLEVLYPTRKEERALGLGPISDINTYANAILTKVFDHARSSKEKTPDFMRSVVFTSCNPNICTALNWKQPNCENTPEVTSTLALTSFFRPRSLVQRLACGKEFYDNNENQRVSIRMVYVLGVHQGVSTTGAEQ
jgi:CDK inhibitor PHO81